jgi:hypothetical protein
MAMHGPPSLAERRGPQKPHLVLLDEQNRKIEPYLTTINRIRISVTMHMKCGVAPGPQKPHLVLLDEQNRKIKPYLTTINRISYLVLLDEGEALPAEEGGAAINGVSVAGVHLGRLLLVNSGVAMLQQLRRQKVVEVVALDLLHIGGAEPSYEQLQRIVPYQVGSTVQKAPHT